MKMITRTMYKHTIHAQQLEGTTVIDVEPMQVVTGSKNIDIPAAIGYLLNRDPDKTYVIQSVESKEVIYGMNEMTFVENARDITQNRRQIIK